MAQAYEYSIVANSTTGAFTADLETADAGGWEVIGFSVLGTSSIWSLMRRRLED